LAHQKYIGAPNTSPSSATLRAIEQQTTPETKREALEYARRRVKMLRWAGRPVSATAARELVDDVHADTWTGDLPWNPSQCSLLEHFRRAIKQRTWLEIRHANRISFVPLREAANEEAAAEEAVLDQPVSEEVEQTLAAAIRERCAPSRLLATLDATCRELRARVGCTEADAVAQCWADGVTERHAVRDLTGLTDAAYESARKRLLYASRTLSAELRESAHDLLRNAF
jgi:hypothetical protein